jgi:hypothetical protein
MGRRIDRRADEKCRWLKPRLIVNIEYLEWTGANHLRHAMFVGIAEKRGNLAGEITPATGYFLLSGANEEGDV